MKVLEKLKKLGYHKEIVDKFIDYIKPLSFEAGQVLTQEELNFRENVIIILEGSLKVSVFLEGHDSFVCSVGEGEIPNIGFIRPFGSKMMPFWDEDLPERNINIEVPEDVSLVIVPMEILQELFLEKEFWSSMFFSLSSLYRRDIFGLLEKSTYDDTYYLIKYLETHNYYVEYNSERDLAELLNIKLRTFQRVVQKLSQSGVIKKGRGYMKVDDLKAFNSLGEKYRLGLK